MCYPDRQSPRLALASGLRAHGGTARAGGPEPRGTRAAARAGGRAARPGGQVGRVARVAAGRPPGARRVDEPVGGPVAVQARAAVAAWEAWQPVALRQRPVVRPSRRHRSRGPVAAAARLRDAGRAPVVAAWGQPVLRVVRAPLVAPRLQAALSVLRARLAPGARPVAAPKLCGRPSGRARRTAQAPVARASEDRTRSPVDRTEAPARGPR